MRKMSVMQPKARVCLIWVEMEIDFVIFKPVSTTLSVKSVKLNRIWNQFKLKSCSFMRALISEYWREEFLKGKNNGEFYFGVCLCETLERVTARLQLRVSCWNWIGTSFYVYTSVFTPLCVRFFAIKSGSKFAALQSHAASSFRTEKKKNLAKIFERGTVSVRFIWGKKKTKKKTLFLFRESVGFSSFLASYF